VWTAVVTWALLKAIDLMVTLRVSRENEVEGLDITQHGEALQ
jgi:Amt family ammonium transporter